MKPDIYGPFAYKILKAIAAQKAKYNLENHINYAIAEGLTQAEEIIIRIHKHYDKTD
jgi:hypothetical protein